MESSSIFFHVCRTPQWALHCDFYILRAPISSLHHVLSYMMASKEATLINFLPTFGAASILHEEHLNKNLIFLFFYVFIYLFFCDHCEVWNGSKCKTPGYDSQYDPFLSPSTSLVTVVMSWSCLKMEDKIKMKFKKKIENQKQWTVMISKYHIYNSIIFKWKKGKMRKEIEYRSNILLL